MKLEDCQTLRYHRECESPHKQFILHGNNQLADNVPMLALVIAMLSYLEHDTSARVFPTGTSAINCRGDFAIAGTVVSQDIGTGVWNSYGMLYGTAISVSAEVKDDKGYATSFKDLVDPYLNRMIRAVTAEGVMEPLRELKRRLEELE